MPEPGSNDADSFDSPWKEAIQLFLRPFLAQCFPEVESGVDWDKAPEFLEQELRELLPDSAVGQQRVDQLIKVWRRDGTEQWVLLHVEVQAQVDRKLPQRLYQYHSRLTGQFGGPVVTLCVLADGSSSFRPVNYTWEFWGCEVQFRFPTCKLLDFSEADLEASSNPIAVVIRAHRATQLTRGDMEKRRFVKAMLVFGLYEKRVTESEFYGLFRLINWLLRLPKLEELAFRQELSEYQETNNMRYITTYDQIVLEEGMELGREEGLVEGKRMAMRETILKTVQRHFNSMPNDLAGLLEKFADDEVLQKVFDLTWDSPSVEDFMAKVRELAS